MKRCNIRITFFIVLVLIVSIFQGRVMAAPTLSGEGYKDKARVIVEEYEISESGAIPGEEFELKLTLKNPSESYNVSSILVTYNNDMEGIYSANKTSNQVYLHRIAAGESKDIVLKLRVADTIKATTTKFELTILYADGESSSNSNVVSIPIAINQSSQLEIQAVSLPNTITVDNKTRVRVTYKNSGAEDLYNITMNIQGTGITESQQVSLGTLSASKTNYVEAYVTFNKVGTNRAQISFNYEDIKGGAYQTKAYEISVDATEKGEGPQGEEKNEESTLPQVEGPQTFAGFDIWQVGIVLAIVIVAGVVVVLFRKYKK